VYRVFPYSPSAAVGEPGHPLFTPPSSGSNRLDNPGTYDVRYFAEQPAAAVAETLGQLVSWEPQVFRAGRSGRRRALATLELPPEVRLLDMDDAQNLLDRDLRPTQVVRRDLAVTQAWALNVHEERVSKRGARRWDGVRWWSWYRPEWPVLGIWSGEPELLDVTVLDLDHPAVREAATLLGRPLPR
jgi:hypothetical protein